MAYQPALDGVRGLAVLMVLCFHQGWSWISGGYVGVSVFFTLSGFLITTLLLREHIRDGRIAPAKFYQRRVKRLMPASLFCLIAVSLMAWVGWLPQSDRLRGDVASAALQVYNWRALTGTFSYAQLLGLSASDSAVAHFWSLAIEEQFYWVWPVAVIGILAATKSWKVRRWVLTGITVVSMALPPLIASRWGGDAAYWSTPARLSEILLGALVAVWLPVWRRYLSYRVLGAMSLLALAGVLWAGCAWPAATGPAYEGWMPVIAVASAGLITGLQGGGPLARLFSTRPATLLGRVSFGVYLYHWPLFLVLDEQRTHLDGWLLFATRMAATLAVATVSYVALERPIREARIPGLRITLSAVGAMAAVLLLAAIVPQPAGTDAYGDFTPSNGFGTDSVPDATLATLVPASSSPTTEPTVMTDASTTTTTIVPSRPVRMLVIGDSTADALARGLDAWASVHPELAQVESVASAGCGLMTASNMPNDHGTFRPLCEAALGERLDKVLTEARPDLVIILVTLPDAVERKFDDGKDLMPTDPEFARRRLADYQRFAQRLEDAGVQHIAWLLAASPAEWTPPGPTGRKVPIDSELINDVVRGLRSSVICPVDLASYVLDAEVDGDRTLRPDGLHLDVAVVPFVLDDYLGQRLLAVALGRCPDT